MPILVVKEGMNKGKSLSLNLKKGQLFCGRGKKVTFQLDDPKIADKHFRLVKNEQLLTLHQLQEEYEIIVNDIKVTGKTSLAVGDTIKIGDSTLEIAETIKTDKPAISKTALPRQIGNYLLESFIGTGFAGSVYRAKQDSMDRTVAVKVLNHVFCKNQEQRNAYLLKARQLSRITHTHIVHIFDICSSDDLDYLVMEYMGGGSLEAILAEGDPLDWKTSLPLFDELTSALAFAESNNLVHGDIRAENILFDDDCNAKFSDFGLTGLQKQSFGKLSHIHFLAPELEINSTPDLQSDLYALGALIYEILSGRTPFTGKNAADIRKQQRQDTPTPIKNFAEDIPKAGADIINRLLEKEPEKRFDSARELAAELDKLTGKTIRKKRSRPGSKNKPVTAITSRPGISAVERMRQKKEKDKCEKIPVAKIYGILVAIALISIITWYCKRPDPTYNAWSKSQRLIADRDFTQALDVVREGLSAFGGSYKNKLNEEEQELIAIIRDKVNIAELKKEWGQYCLFKRENQDDLEERKRRIDSLWSKVKNNAYARIITLTDKVKKEKTRIKNED